MMQLFELIPAWVEGKYNYKDISVGDWEEMKLRGKQFPRRKTGLRPQTSPYVEKLRFELPQRSAPIIRPFFDRRQGFVAHEDVAKVIDGLTLAPHVCYPLLVLRGTGMTRYFYYYFFTSMRKYISLAESLVHIVKANAAKLDPETGKFVETIVRQAKLRDVEDLDFLGRSIEGEVLWCEKLVLKSEIQMFDIFELDVEPTRILLSRVARDRLLAAQKTIEIVSPNVYISENA